MLQQKISKKYIDKQRMDSFLVDNFGADGFEVEVGSISLACYPRSSVRLIVLQVKSEVYLLTVPRELTEVSGNWNLFLFSLFTFTL